MTGLKLQELKELAQAWSKRHEASEVALQRVLAAANLLQSFMWIVDCECNPAARELQHYKYAVQEVYGE